MQQGKAIKLHHIHHFYLVSLSPTVLRQWHQVIKKDIIFLDELFCVCSLIDPKAPCPAKGPSAFPRDAEPYQSASKALFVAPRYSDFFLCFIHIFLRRLGVPHRLPPVSGREASAPGGRDRSYSVVFLQCCLWSSVEARSRVGEPVTATAFTVIWATGDGGIKDFPSNR